MQKGSVRNTRYIILFMLVLSGILLISTSSSLETASLHNTATVPVGTNTNPLIVQYAGSIKTDTKTLFTSSETLSLKTISNSTTVNTAVKVNTADTAVSETAVNAESVSLPDTADSLKAEKDVTPAVEPRVIQEMRSRIEASGRKMAEVNYSQKFYLNNPLLGVQDPVITTPQELQFRLHGKVGDRITVDFEYDDTQKKQKISVIYTGDARDAIQEVNFGDQVLSLPGTEFVAYNKQLFGLSVRGQYSKLKYYFIGSQVKGYSATKQFEGKTGSTVVDINDTNYVKNKYYVVGHIDQDKERVYVDDQDGNNDNGSRNFYLSFQDGVVSDTITGHFDWLMSGIDYSISYGDVGESTVISFIKSIGTNYVIVVCNASTTENTFAIKDAGNSDLRSAMYELKNRYYLGNRNIVQLSPTDERFRLSVKDKSSGETLIGVWPNADKGYAAKLDYDLGTIQFVDKTTGKDVRPFNADAYQYSSPVQTYTVHAEYKYRISDFLLQPFMVEESELVYLNGVKQRRDIDYTIDYQSGFLTFLDENRIADNTIIKIDYNYTGFTGGGYVETLLGVRGELPLTNDFRIGTTYIFTGTPYVDDIPKYSSTPKSHQIVDIDSQMDVKSLAARTKSFSSAPFDGTLFFPWLKLVDRLVKVFASSKTPITSNLALEGAYSWKNPNTFGKAMIDDMEGAKLSLNVSMTDTAVWRISSAPLGETEGYRGNIGSGLFDLKLTAAGNNHDPRDEVSRAVVIEYNLDPESWVAIVYPIPSSQNLSAYSDLEFYMQSTPGDVDFNIDIGEISEDADGSGGFPNDVYYNGTLLWHKGYPKTEDIIIRDGKLNTGEDNGWTFDNGYLGPQQIGAGNFRLDKEDLDGDNVMDGENTSTLHRFGGNGTALDKYLVSATNWRFYSIPLSHQTSGNTDWTNVKHVRLWIKNNSGSSKSGSIVMDSLQIVGNKWTNISVTDSSTGNSFSVETRNTVDNTLNNTSVWGPYSYTDPRKYTDAVLVDLDKQNGYNDAFEELHPSMEDDFYGLGENLPKEQSIALVYNFAVSNTASVKQVFTSPINFSEYKSLKFWLGVTDQSYGDTLFIRLGTDCTNPDNYFQETIYVTPSMRNHWTVIEIDISDLANKNTDTLGILSQIKEMVIGVISDTGTANKKELWINEIHLTGAKMKEGYAFKAAMSGIIGPATYNTSYKKMTHTFETIGVSNPAQDFEAVSAGWSMPVSTFMPASWGISMPYSGSWSKTLSELDSLTVKDMSTSLMGSREDITQNHSLGFSRVLLPSLSASYTNSKIDSNFKNAEQRQFQDVYSGSASYSYTFPNWLWYSLSVSPIYTYGSTYRDVRRAPDFIDYTLYLDRSQSFATAFNYKPVSGVDVNPSYNLSVSDYRKSETYSMPLGEIKPVSRSQGIAISSSTSLIKGVSPSANLNEGIAENYFATNMSTSPMHKNAGANVSVGVNANFVPSTWHESLKFFTFYNNFSISASGSYSDLEKDLSPMEINADIWTAFVNLKDKNSPLYSKRTSGSNRNNYSLSANFYLWDPLSLSSNLSLGQSQTQSQNSFSTSKSLGFGGNARLDLKNAYPKYSTYAKSSNLIGSYSQSILENLGSTDIISSRSTSITPSVSWQIRWNNDWNQYYLLNWYVQLSEGGIDLQDKIVTHTVSPSVRSDYHIEKPLTIVVPALKWPPWTSYVLANRFDFNHSAGFEFRRSSSGIIEKMIENVSSNKFGTSFGVTGNISDNFQVNFSFGLDWFDDMLILGDEYVSITFSLRGVFRF